MYFFFFQAEDGIRDADVTGVQTCALPISDGAVPARMLASKENPTKLVPSLAPEPDPTVTVAVAAGASSASAEPVPAASRVPVSKAATATGAIDLSGRIRRRGLMGVLGGGVARSCWRRSGLTSDV